MSIKDAVDRVIDFLKDKGYDHKLVSLDETKDTAYIQTTCLYDWYTDPYDMPAPYGFIYDWHNNSKIVINRG